MKAWQNQYDYGMRIYDPRAGRFLSVDPITRQYPQLTPYQFSSNNPIFFIDIDGLEGDYFFRKDDQGNFTLVNYIDNGKGAPNRFFVYDGKVTDGAKKYRYESKGSYWRMELTPSSFYDEDDYYNYEYLVGGKINGQSQFDKDRRAWLVQGANYTDLDYLERLWKDNGDNPDAGNMRRALMLSATPSSPKGMRAAQKVATEEIVVPNKPATAANSGNTKAALSNAATRGMGNSNTRASVNLGNKIHYDALNGSTGTGLPTELALRYPNTTFKFARRGESGADVEITGGTHPSKYPNSTWDPKNNFGDFKPNSLSGNKKFNTEINNGKIPKNTQKLLYDPSSGKLQ